MTIVSISIPENLLADVDRSVKKQGFANRSEIIRQALRSFIAEDRNLRETEGEIIATITIIYERRARGKEISDIQHSYGEIISTYLHVHIDKGHCLEVIVVKGETNLVKKLVDAFKTNEQIIQMKVTVLGV